MSCILSLSRYLVRATTQYYGGNLPRTGFCRRSSYATPKVIFISHPEACAAALTENKRCHDEEVNKISILNARFYALKKRLFLFPGRSADHPAHSCIVWNDFNECQSHIHSRIQIHLLTIRGPISSLDDAVDSTIGLDLLAENGYALISEYGGVECILAFPGSCSGVRSMIRY